MHTIRLQLDTTKYDEQIINKRFYALSHIHNVLVKHAIKLLSKLSKNSTYQALLSEYSLLLKKNELSDEDIELKKSLSSQMSSIRIGLGLSEFGLQAYIKECAKQYTKCLSSQQVQKEASRVWKGVEKVLFSNGKKLHFKKNMDFSTISGKTNTNGVKFDKNTLSIKCIGLDIKCKLPKKSKDYILESLDNDISYCEIERKMFPNGWHYYVIVYLKGDAPKKINITHNKKNKTGIDIGTSTVATVSDDKVVLTELAPLSKEYNKKIQKLQYHMDLSKRKTNPNKYNANGTIKKGNKDKWIYSKTYLKNRQKLKSLYRQKSAYIKQSHERLCNELLENSNIFIVEDMCFKGLQKKSKTTARQEKATTIKATDGTTKTIHKFKKKKRFGKSLNNKAPAMFISILEAKSKQYGGKLLKVKTKQFKASQYDHSIDDFVKCELNDREKFVNNVKVQRDLYSAFLLKNSNSKLDKANRKKCIKEFDKFVEMQNNLINYMKANNISCKQCFGF